MDREGKETTENPLLSETECKAACSSNNNCKTSIFTPVTLYPNLMDDYSKDCQDVCDLSDECNTAIKNNRKGKQCLITDGFIKENTINHKTFDIIETYVKLQNIINQKKNQVVKL